MPTRKEQAALTRKKIIEAAKEKIKTESYDSIRIVDIAKACNMSTGNFYHYFGSLDELFSEIDSIEFYENFDSLKNDEAISVIKRLKSYFIEWLTSTVNCYGSDYMYNWTRRYTFKNEKGEDDNRIRLIAGHITQILSEGIKTGELYSDTPVENISYTIAFLIFGASVHFGISNNSDFIRQWSTNACEIFLEPALSPYLKKDPAE